MQAEAARSKARARTTLRMTVALTIVGAALPAAAQGLPDGRKQIIRPSQIQPISPSARCAMYGEGFAPVAGSDSCVKIGGRLRIDLGASARAPIYSGPHDGVNPAAHLRVGP
jgi:hypothetical protein